MLATYTALRDLIAQLGSLRQERKNIVLATNLLPRWRPVAPPAGTPAHATAKCKDATYSFAKGHSGACSSHGGVAERSPAQTWQVTLMRGSANQPARSTTLSPPPPTPHT